MQSIESLIDDAFERRNELTQAEIETHLRPAIGQVLDLLESGEHRVAEPDGQGGWKVNQWLKKAVLLYFRINGNRVVDGGPALAFDKVPLRFAHGDDAELQGLGAIASDVHLRHGSGGLEGLLGQAHITWIVFNQQQLQRFSARIQT